ncbi:MAG: restriction endonuclease PLD domain-containing protein [Reyranella sp.]
MRYIDSGLREASQTVAYWMTETIASEIREFRCQAGYFTLEGSGVLLPILKQIATDGAVIRLLLGSNGGATLASHVAYLAGWLGVPQKHVSLGVVSFETSLFHPKVYHFTRKNGTQTAYVGSANLTGPGISGMNVEAGVILDSQEGDSVSVLQEMVQRIESWFSGSLPGLSPITNAKDVDDLLSTGHLALIPAMRPRDRGEEGSEAADRPSPSRARLRSIFKLPAIEREETERDERREQPLRVAESKSALLVRHTEASFHYPQGTHLGHILSILWHFSGNRQDTPFDDKFIRLGGSLGEGRIAGYRRQVKYKMLAAIELGLITDIRLVEDSESYTPELTDVGTRLWQLLQPFIDVNDLVLTKDAEGNYSSEMRRAAYYNELLRSAQAKSPQLRELYQSVFLNMPAVMQMLKFLYHEARSPVVQKASIYKEFFQSAPVQKFCDLMGIDPATEEGAKHRCPLLLNILDSCTIVTQSSRDVTVVQLALSPELLVAEGQDAQAADALLPIVISEWGTGASSLSGEQQRNLRSLFGETFLTRQYYLGDVFKVPKNVQ